MSQSEPKHTLSDDSTQRQLFELAVQIDSHSDWWRFPTEEIVQGFMGTDPVLIVGDQPSTSSWEYSNPNRRTFYELLAKVGAGNAHLTDLYKRRGLSGALLEGLPSDFAEHLTLFRQEIDILKPKRVVALGHHAYGLLADNIPEIKPLLTRMWHFAYVVRYNKIARYEANIREALEAPSAFPGSTRA